MSEVDVVEEVVTTKKSKKQKHELPEGFVTPVGFTKAIKELFNEDIRPQVIYGNVKNSKSFQEFVSLNTDGRTILNLEAALQWWTEKDTRKAERDAAKAAKASSASEEN